MIRNINMKDFLQQINNALESISFEQVISIIDKHYTFTPSEFSNGDTLNEVNQNNGSCKIFAFSKLQNLTEEQTLHCFGDYYRKDVLENKTGTDHQNIRNFMLTGWRGIKFNSTHDALTLIK